MSTFSSPLRETIEGYLTRYETRRSAILPVLHAIQDAEGWVQPEHIESLHNDFGLDRVEVREVLTFYSMYRREKPHRFEVYFCNNLVCHMLGADEAMAQIRTKIAAYEARGEESPVGLVGVPCLGVCDGAPAMLVNKERHLKVTAANVDEILEKYLR